MLYLSQDDIEVIGESLLRDYTKRSANGDRMPFDIDVFARDYLKLDIRHKKLSDYGKILGLTTYKDVELELEFKAGNEIITVPEDTILLEERLQSFDNRRRERFTVAHECAHQVIARMDEKRTGTSYRKELISRGKYSCRQLKTAEDWSEWQANSLGAVLLMPRKRILADMDVGFKPFRPTLYGRQFNHLDYQRIKSMSDRYGVSGSAMILRIKELGLVISKPETDYYDPLFIGYG